MFVRTREAAVAERTAQDVRRSLQSTGANLLFGMLALLIAAVGLYSTVAYERAQRTHEFGVR